MAPETGAQNLSLARMSLAVAAADDAGVWFSWDDDEAHIRYWDGNRWATADVPDRPGFSGVIEPRVTLSPSGEAFVVGNANGDDNAFAVHVARWQGDRWRWLGDPLISVREPYRHARNPSMVVTDIGPVVAWTEARDGVEDGIVVAQWRGQAWQRFATIAVPGSDVTLKPVVATDAGRRVWLAWSDPAGAVHVVRWDGDAWRPVDAPGLAAVSAAQGVTFASAHSLVVDRRGGAWLLRSVHRGSGFRLALARWDGRRWSDVPTPDRHEGAKPTATDSVMVLRHDRPLLAWSEEDTSENRRLFVAEWRGDSWSSRLAGLHLAPGVSSVVDVTLATGTDDSLFVAWDERGSDQRRLRVVRASPCAAGETPAVPPPSIVERETWPTSVAEAAARIVTALDEESKARVRATPRDRLSEYHLGWGMGIRNSMGLWRDNTALLASCGHGAPVHPDDCSMRIIEAVWQRLQETTPAH